MADPAAHSERAEATERSRERNDVICIYRKMYSRGGMGEKRGEGEMGGRESEKGE
jgi:hypothetical protein